MAEKELFLADVIKMEKARILVFSTPVQEATMYGNQKRIKGWGSGSEKLECMGRDRNGLERYAPRQCSLVKPPPLPGKALIFVQKSCRKDRLCMQSRFSK